MTAKEASFITGWYPTITAFDPQAWDRLALPQDSPFFEWEWLFQLEASGSIGAETGWQPAYLAVWKVVTPENRHSKNTPAPAAGPTSQSEPATGASQLVAAAPFFIKTHSEGEFVFDQPLAGFAEQLHFPYYPKLVGMSPFTPVPGYRWLTDSAEDSQLLAEVMLKEVDRFCQTHKLYSCQFNYTAAGWAPGGKEEGFHKWAHPCFNWHNPGLHTFEDYLNLFNKNQRRNIKREREKLRQQHIRIASYAGADIPDSLFSHMYELYENTNDKYSPWDCKYLTADFFEGLKARYKKRLLFIAAFSDEAGKPDDFADALSPIRPVRKPLGLAFLLVKNDRLYGRYWGSYSAVDSLHFNLCFYSPIEWALAHKVKHFDPGIGSSHKSRRGFIAIPNYSFHRYYSPAFARFVEPLIDQLDGWEQEHIQALNSRLPFAHDRH